MVYNCDKCKKEYSSYQSLWIHNKKYHINKIETIITNTVNTIKCNHCDKIFKTKYILNNHLKICHIKKFNDNLINIEKSNNDELNLELIKLEQIKEQKEILKLKIQLKSTSIPNTTNNNINNINQLLNNSNNTNSNNVFNILTIGRENIEEILSQLEKKTILNSRFSCLEELVKIIHCGEYNQFRA